MELNMQSEVQGDVRNMTLDGELTLTHSAGFKAWVTEQLETGPYEVELDCRQLSYIDSTGLGALIFLRKRVLDHNGVLRLVHVSGWLRKFLQVTGLEETFIGTGEQVDHREPQS